MIKLPAKRTDFHQVDICKVLMYLQCLEYRTTTQLQKKIQDGSSVIEAKLLLDC